MLICQLSDLCHRNWILRPFDQSYCSIHDSYRVSDHCEGKASDQNCLKCSINKIFPSQEGCVILLSLLARILLHYIVSIYIATIYVLTELSTKMATVFETSLAVLGYLSV